MITSGEREFLDAIKTMCRTGPSQRLLDSGMDATNPVSGKRYRAHGVLYTVFQSGSDEEAEFLSSDTTPKLYTVLGRDYLDDMAVSHVLITPDDSDAPWVKEGDIPPLR